MRKILNNLFRRSSTQQEEELSQKAELQRLRLALAEANDQRKRLEADLVRQRVKEEEQNRAVIEKLLTDLADPAAQFLLQLDLSERQAKEVHNRDTLAVARNLLKILTSYGLTPLESAGEICPFDPASHSMMAGGTTLQPGQPVLIRIPGLAYQGRRVRKAGVTLLEN